MNIDRHERISRLFLEVCELDEAQREEVLLQACKEDASLRGEVEAMLEADESKQSPLDDPVLGSDFDLRAEAAQVSPDEQLVGKQIAGCHLRRVIATGGMGTVYEAVQEKPRRIVAVKVIRSGITSQSAARRLEYESQILARLRHPGIAQIYEAGTSEELNGLPYFVMEFIADATTVTDYARERKLSVIERLGLFDRICDAVHHGHQKGVIHRDLKPGNILVDATSGEPKVIDFGVARATDSDIAITTLQTDVGQLIGTLQYMSPEQCEGNAHDLDTRSDVYSLGVVLYELLCDQVPYDVSSGTVPQAIQVIREEAPARPSTINRTVRGDLETITLKALEKERQHRYDSAAALADDIRRYLNDEPIVARPASAMYQLRKFARRNRGIVAATAIALTALLSALVVSIHFAVRESRASAEAAQQTAVAEAVNDFLTDDLLGAIARSVEQGKGKDVLMRDVLDEAGKRIEEASIAGGRFEDKPVIEASIRATLGHTYWHLGEYAAAEPHLKRARMLRRRELGQEHPDTLDSMNMLANLYGRQGRYDEAEPLYLQTLEIRKRVLGEEHPSTLKSMNNLAGLYSRQGRYDEAEPLYLQTLEIQKRVVGEEHPDTLIYMGNLAILHRNQGRYDEAEPLALQTLELQKRVLGDEHPVTLLAMTNLAILYGRRGRYDEAEPLYVKSLEITKRVLGEEHPSTLGRMNNLAGLYKNQGRYDEAEPLYLQTLKIQKRVVGEEHPDTLSFMGNLANLYKDQGRYDEAEPLYVKSLEITKRVLGEEHPRTLNSMNNLAGLYSRQGRYDEAEPLYLQTLEIQKRVVGEEHPDTLIFMGNLAILYQNQGRYTEAEPLFVKTLEIKKRVLGEEHPGTLRSMSNLALLYKNQGRYDEAEPLYVKRLEIQKRVLGEEHSETLRTMAFLANSYEREGRTNDLRRLVRALQEIERRRADQPGASANDKNTCAWSLLTCEPADLRDPETALRLAREASAMTNHANPAILDTLALAQHLTGDTAAAIETEKKALSLLPADASGRGEYEAALAKFEAALKDESK